MDDNPAEIAQEFIDKLKRSHHSNGELIVAIAEKLKAYKDFSDYKFNEENQILTGLSERVKVLEEFQSESNYTDLINIARKDHEYLQSFRIMWKVITGFVFAIATIVGFLLGTMVDLQKLL